MEYVRLIPQRLIDTSPRVKVELKELERAERLRRELHNLLSIQVDNWPKVIETLLIEDGKDEQRADVMEQAEPEVETPVIPAVVPEEPPPKAPVVVAPVPVVVSELKWHHLPRCHQINP